jgi:hypothetical protein
MTDQTDGPGAAGRSEPGFGADLATSARTLWRSPLLVIIALVVWAGLPFLPRKPVFSLVFWALLLFGTGFRGTVRVWFLRAWLGERRMNFGEVWNTSWKLFGRFFLLSLLYSLPLFFIGLIQVAVHNGSPAYLRWEFLPFLLAIDIAITFVVPMLALDTKSVIEAVGSGSKMIGQTWPRSAPYVLVPGMTAVVVFNLTLRQWIGLSYAGPVGVIATLVALWFDGAVTMYYLRHRPAFVPSRPDEGSIPG